MIEIIDSKIFIEGKETTDPMLIGLAFLDMVESFNEPQSNTEKIEQLIKNFNQECKNLGFENQSI